MTLPQSEILKMGYIEQVQLELLEAPMTKDLIESVIKTFGDDWPLATSNRPREAQEWLNTRISLVKLLRKVVK